MNVKNKICIAIFVIIIGIFMAWLIIPQYSFPQAQARITGARTQISLFCKALDAFQVDNGFYPSTFQGLMALVECPRTPTTLPKWNGPYLRCDVPNDSWGKPYVYYCPPEHPQPDLEYEIISAGEDGKFGTKDDITNWNMNEH